MRMRLVLVAVLLAAMLGLANDAGDVLIPEPIICQQIDPCGWFGWLCGCSCPGDSGGGGGSGAGVE